MQEQVQLFSKDDKSLSLSEVSKRATFAIKEPGLLPTGFELVQALHITRPEGEFALLNYRNETTKAFLRALYQKFPDGIEVRSGRPLTIGGRGATLELSTPRRPDGSPLEGGDIMVLTIYNDDHLITVSSWKVSEERLEEIAATLL